MTDPLIEKLSKAINTRLDKKKTVRIFAFLLDRTFGDFTVHNMFISGVKSLFDDAELYVYFRNDRVYKKQVLDMNADIDVVIEMTGNSSYPVDFFDRAGDRPISHPNARWYQKGLYRPDIVLMPSMMHEFDLKLFPYYRKLRPKAPEAELTQKLVDLGLDPNRWFCTLHYREPTAKFRSPQPMRDQDPKKFDLLIDRMIEDFGGQVVRIGHPEMTPFRPRPGFVDLSGFEDDVALQFFAVSKARYHICTPSGTATVGNAVGTPLAFVCETSNQIYGPGKQDVVLLSHFLTPDGRRVSNRSLFSDKFAQYRWKQILAKEMGFTVVHNSLDELMAMMRHMLKVTEDTQGWRVLDNSPPPSPRPNKLVLPFPQDSWPTPVIEFPELAPGNGVFELGEGDAEFIPYESVTPLS